MEQRSSSRTEIQKRQRSNWNWIWMEPDKQILIPESAFLTTCWTDLPDMDFFDLKLRVTWRSGGRRPSHHRRYGNRPWKCHPKKLWETKKASAAMEAAFFLWMSPWSSVQSICPDDRILPGMQNLPQTRSVIWHTEMVKEFFYAVSYSCRNESSYQSTYRREQPSYGRSNVQKLCQGTGSGSIF